MNHGLDDFLPQRRRSSARLPRNRTDGEFICRHCHNTVTFNALWSGAHNRNHCPYCLWSRHLDLEQPGDRLAACRGAMRPIGLTLKRVRRRYAGAQAGELMLVHRCEDCERISINRIAADDLAYALEEVYAASLRLPNALRACLAAQSIVLLGDAERGLVQARLYGAAGTNIIQTVYTSSEMG